MKYLKRSAIALTAIVLWQGLVRRPTPRAEGDHLNQPTVMRPIAANPVRYTSTSNLRIAAFNIAGGVSPSDNRLDLSRTAKYLSQFDLVGLEEVHGATLFGRQDQAEILGNELDDNWLFAPSETRWWHNDFGNGALSDLPVAHWDRIPLNTVLASSNRCLLKLAVEWHEKTVTVLITHLDRHIDHIAELGAVRAAFYDAPTPVILMGDLNTEGPEPLLNEMRSNPSVVDALGLGQANNPLQPKLDWIFARGLRFVSGGLLANDASDHTLAWAQFADETSPPATRAAFPPLPVLGEWVGVRGSENLLARGVAP